MATGKTNSKKNNATAGETHIGFFRKKETQVSFGIVFVVLMAWLTTILISFFFSGGYDQSIIHGLPFSELESISGKTNNLGGSSGAWLANLMINEWFGFPILFPVLFGWIFGLKLLGITNVSLIKSFFLTTFFLLWGALFLAFFVQPFMQDSYIVPGGNTGFGMSAWLGDHIGWPGTLLVIVGSIAIFMVFVKLGNLLSAKKFLPFKLFKRKNKIVDSDNVYTATDGEKPEEFDRSWTGDQANEPAEFQNTKTSNIPNFEDEEADEDENENEKPTEPLSEEPPLPTELDFEIKVGKGDGLESEPEEPVVRSAYKSNNARGEEEYDASELGEYDPKLDLSTYKFPTLNLLTRYESSETVVNTEEQKSNKRRIQDVLEQFSIKISSISATVGPTVTLYEIIPEPGVRISRIKSLENDIALSLAALGIRIIAPIPGKGTIGIEVPNRDPQIVSMYSVVNSKKFQESKYDLPMALGRTITNDVFMVDLCKMPHVLVAGATGQGKSVGLNAMITSLLYKKHPAELKFVMVDPKMVEFSVYSIIEKHFLAKLPDDSKAIITDSDKVKQTLNSLTREMDDRYNLLMLAGVRNVKEYNTKYVSRRLNPEKGHKYLPYIVVIIDEFGDLIMTAGKEIEMPIARIAQKARAVGIHMIIATQRPTTNIITGTIKANFPSRVAFRVSSGVDSRTILDALGANQLIGRGDMLFSQGSDLVRVQCAFVDTPEVVNVARFISDQRSYPTPFYLPEPTIDGNGGNFGTTDMDAIDPIFEDAARLIVVHQQGSTSLIQRKFSIGYNRAGRIVDQLEQAGIIGPSEGSKARQVLVADEFQLEHILARLK